MGAPDLQERLDALWQGPLDLEVADVVVEVAYHVQVRGERATAADLYERALRLMVYAPHDRKRLDDGGRC